MAAVLVLFLPLLRCDPLVVRAAGPPPEVAPLGRPPDHVISLVGFKYSPCWLFFSPDGKRLAVVESDAIHVWEVAAGKKLCLCTVAKDFYGCVAFSADGRLLATGGDNLEKANGPGEIKLFDAATGRELRTLNRHSDGVSALAFRPDGKVLATGAGDCTVRLWDVAAGKQLHRLEGPDGGIDGVAFSADGRLLAATGWHTGVWLFDAHTAKQLRVLKSDQVCSAPAFSPDGRLLAAAVSEHRTVRVWETASGKPLLDFPKNERPGPSASQLAFTPDGERVLSCNGDQTLLWEARGGKVLWRYQHKRVVKRPGVEVWQEALSSDGRWYGLMTNDANPYKARIWRVAPAAK